VWLAKSFKQEDHPMLYLAIDQHSKQLTVNLRDEDGQTLLRRQVSTRWQAVRAFFEELSARSAAQGGYMAILEVCGFNDWLVDLLPRVGCRELVLVCPAGRGLTKTDRRDADQLGQLLWINRQRLANGQRVHGLRRVRPATPRERTDRRLTMLRRNVGRQRTRVINQVKHLLLARNLLHDLPTRGIQTKLARCWLQQLKLDLCDRLELDQLLEAWQLHDRQLAQLEERIAQRQAAHPAAGIVASLPGAGGYTALALASRIGPIERFKSPRSLANYFGIVPSCRNSGQATRRLGSITKAGSPIARFLLGQLVLHVLKRDPAMRCWYKAIRQRRGSKIARVAVMRRLTTILWHMLKHQQPYKIGGPPRRKLAQPVDRSGGSRRGRDQSPQFPLLCK
jgi:transposase